MVVKAVSERSAELVKIVSECLKRLEEYDKAIDKKSVDVETVRQRIEEIRPYLSILTSKWIPEILYALELREEMGFNELKQILKISSRVLSDKLQELVNMGLVERVVEERGRGYRSRYRLTEKGKKVIYAMTPFLVGIYVYRI